MFGACKSFFKHKYTQIASTHTKIESHTKREKMASFNSSLVPQMMFQIPRDVWLQCFRYLKFTDIYSLTITCKALKTNQTNNFVRIVKERMQERAHEIFPPMKDGLFIQKDHPFAYTGSLLWSVLLGERWKDQDVDVIACGNTELVRNFEPEYYQFHEHYFPALSRAYDELSMNGFERDASRTTISTFDNEYDAKQTHSVDIIWAPESFKHTVDRFDIIGCMSYLTNTGELYIPSPMETLFKQTRVGCTVSSEDSRLTRYYKYTGRGIEFLPDRPCLGLDGPLWDKIHSFLPILDIYAVTGTCRVLHRTRGNQLIKHFRIRLDERVHEILGDDVDLHNFFQHPTIRFFTGSLVWSVLVDEKWDNQDIDMICWTYHYSIRACLDANNELGYEWDRVNEKAFSPAPDSVPVSTLYKGPPNLSGSEIRKVGTPILDIIWTPFEELATRSFDFIGCTGLFKSVRGLLIVPDIHKTFRKETCVRGGVKVTQERKSKFISRGITILE